MRKLVVFMAFVIGIPFIAIGSLWAIVMESLSYGREVTFDYLGGGDDDSADD